MSEKKLHRPQHPGVVLKLAVPTGRRLALPHCRLKIRIVDPILDMPDNNHNPSGRFVRFPFTNLSEGFFSAEPHISHGTDYHTQSAGARNLLQRVPREFAASASHILRAGQPAETHSSISLLRQRTSLPIFSDAGIWAELDNRQTVLLHTPSISETAATSISAELLLVTQTLLWILSAN